MTKKKAIENQVETETVEAKHVISFTAPYKVLQTSDEVNSSFDDDDDDDDDLESLPSGSSSAVLNEVEIIEENETGESTKSNAAKLRAELAAAGLFQVGGLLLVIEKFTAAVGSGIRSPRSPIATLELTKEELKSRVYLETIYAHGQGRYLLTLRMPSGELAKRWQLFVKAEDLPQQPAPPVQFIQNNPNDDFEKTFELLERIEKFRAKNQPAPVVAPPPSLDPELAIASYILKSPQGLKKMSQQLFGPQGESESLAVTLLQNVEPIMQGLTQIVGVIFANIQAMQQNGAAVPIVPQQFSNLASHVEQLESLTDPIKQAVAFIIQSNEKTKPSVAAQRLIIFSDFAKTNGSETLESFLESFISLPVDDVIILLQSLAGVQNVNVLNRSWVMELCVELSSYFTTEPEKEAETKEGATIENQLA